MRISGNVVKVLGFLIGLAGMLLVLSIVFRRDNNMNIYDMKAVKEKELQIREEKDNSLDVLFLGDSECYSSFSPLCLWSQYGYTSFVCATSGQRLCDTYAILENAFDSQSPSVVVLETNCLYRNPSSRGDDSDSVMHFLSNRLPVFAYHSDWKNLVGGIKTKCKNKGDALKGFVVRKNVNPYNGGPYMYHTQNIKKFPVDSYFYLNKINTLCRDNHAALLLVSTPSPVNWDYEKHNGVSEWAKENSVLYMDMNLEESISIDWTSDTKDGGDHLNLAGAKKVTSYIGGYLDKMYSLPDRRSDPMYQEWADCYAESAHSMD